MFLCSFSVLYASRIHIYVCVETARKKEKVRVQVFKFVYVFVDSKRVLNSFVSLAVSNENLIRIIISFLFLLKLSSEKKRVSQTVWYLYELVSIFFRITHRG